MDRLSFESSRADPSTLSWWLIPCKSPSTLSKLNLWTNSYQGESENWRFSFMANQLYFLKSRSDNQWQTLSLAKTKKLYPWMEELNSRYLLIFNKVLNKLIEWVWLVNLLKKKKKKISQEIDKVLNFISDNSSLNLFINIFSFILLWFYPYFLFLIYIVNRLVHELFFLGSSGYSRLVFSVLLPCPRSNLHPKWNEISPFNLRLRISSFPLLTPSSTLSLPFPPASPGSSPFSLRLVLLHAPSTSEIPKTRKGQLQPQHQHFRTQDP